MLRLNNISCNYGSENIIEAISFDVKKGEILSILGANGSGKSTLLKAIVGLLPYKGNLLLDGIESKDLSVKKRASLVAYVPQSTVIPFEFNVLEVVLMGRFHDSSFGLNYSKEDEDLALKALSQVGIEDFSQKIYRYLSGGQRQLVLIARALAQQSPLIIMDEPVTGLDLGNQIRLLDLMEELSSLGHTVVQTTHNPDHALRVSQKVVWIHNRNILSFGEPNIVVNPENIRKVYQVESELFTHERGMTHLLAYGFIKKENL